MAKTSHLIEKTHILKPRTVKKEYKPLKKSNNKNRTKTYKVDPNDFKEE